MKKVISILLTLALVFAMGAVTVFAATTTTVNSYSELTTVIGSAVAGDTIKLGADISFTGAGNIVITKAITIDMNGFNIIGNPTGSNGKSFIVNNGGDLNLINTGTTGGRVLPGAGEANESSYRGIRIEATSGGTAKATVGTGVSIETGLPVMVYGNGTPGSAQLDVYGKLVVTTLIEFGVNIGLSWATISGNGTYGGTIINIYPGAEVLNEFSSPLYIPQSGVVNVFGGTIIGKQSAIAIKSGTLNISGGTLRATGPATIPTEGWSSGINGSGCAIQIESNNVYAGNVIVNITGGSISSLNGYALYEYLSNAAPATTQTKVSGITATAGTLQGSTALGSAYLFSAELTAKDLAEPNTVDLTGATLGNDATGQSEVKANADVTYTVIIPASVDFGTITKTTPAQSKAFNVSIVDALLESGSSITVAKTTGDMNMYAGTIPLAFTFAPPEGGFVFLGVGTKSGTVGCTPATLTAAGSYKGFMTFSVTYTPVI